MQPDMPWFEARFIPTEAFATVEPLFREELSERREFAVHLYDDGTARFRY